MYQWSSYCNSSTHLVFISKQGVKTHGHVDLDRVRIFEVNDSVILLS